MATEEYLNKFIAAGKVYGELPDRFRQGVSEDDWRRKVKDYCIARGFSWVASTAHTVCSEADYYEDLLRAYRANKRLFPYHLGEYVCRQMRSSAFCYYSSLLVDAMKEDLPYDTFPNFTAADIVRILGIGRNEYIALMQQAKSKKLMWRMNRGFVRDLLPQAPLNIQIDPWWVVHVVNLGEAEYRQLDASEATACHIAARPGGARYADLNGLAVRQLYLRGLVWLEVPARGEDHLSIPPLEGFVSNRTAVAAGGAGGGGMDPLEALLYQVFVAASDRVTVAKLADILSVDLPTLRVAISMACRLRFCRKLDAEGNDLSTLLAPAASLVAPPGLGGHGPLASERLQSSMLDQLDLDAMLRSPDVGGPGLPESPAAAMAAAAVALDDGSGGGGGGEAGGTGIAFVVDSEVTGMLMMGALTPNCKKHSVTLFEGGRVYGAEVIAELTRELHASVEMSAGFEGEMRSLVAYARSLALVLECIRECSGGGGGAGAAGGRAPPIELLRRESLAGMPPQQAFRILSHSYGVVLPITSLAAPPLPLSLRRAASPVNYGPLPAAQTPWLQLALYAALGAGPTSLVLAAGQQLVRLPAALQGATHALLWPWDAAAVKAKQSELPTVVAVAVAGPEAGGGGGRGQGQQSSSASSLLYCLNEHLTRTALLVQPLRLPPPRGAAGSGSSSGGSSSGGSGGSGGIVTVDVALPLPLPQQQQQQQQARRPVADGWNPFELGDAGGSGGSSSSRGDAAEAGCTAVGYLPSGEAVPVTLPPGLLAALHRLGLGGSLGCLRLLQEPPPAAAASTHAALDGQQAASAAGSSSSQEPQQRWLPLAIWLGMPMVPSELCQAVCEAARAAAFLDASARQAQREAQGVLAAALQALAARHGACSTSFAGGGKDDDLGTFVDRPIANLLFAGGRLTAVDLGGAVAGGVPLLLP